MPQTPPPNGAKLPLANLLVLDLTLARAGPTCVRHLADWGANVIRITGAYAAEDTVNGSWRHASGVQGSGSWCFAADYSRDSIEIIGHRSLYPRDPLLHHFVRGLLHSRARERDAEIKRLRGELSKAVRPKSPRRRKAP